MKLIVSIFALVLISTPQLLIAHGEGASYEEEINGYFVDIGYDPATVVAGKRVRFDFNTYPVENDTATTSFTDVWVSIEQAGELVFSGGINRPVFGATGFNLVLPNGGTYEVKARFQNNGEKVVEATFPIEVTPGAVSSQKTSSQTLMAIAVAALIALCVGFFVGRRAQHAA